MSESPPRRPKAEERDPGALRLVRRADPPVVRRARQYVVVNESILELDGHENVRT
jgi:hypothetical protein